MYFFRSPPFCLVLTVFYGQSRTPVPTMCGGSVRRRIVLFSPFILCGRIWNPPLRCGGVPPFILPSPFVLCGRFVNRPYKNNKTLSLPVGEDSISSRNVVRIYQQPSPVGEGGSRRLTDEVSVSLFALPFGFAQTNGNHLPPCRDRASVQQVASLSVVGKIYFRI